MYILAGETHKTLATENIMIEINDSVEFADKFENWLQENCVGEFTFEQRAIAGRALMNMIDEMDN